MSRQTTRDEPLIDETAWMLTLSDLLMLLLTLFALRLSMGQLRPESLPSTSKIRGDQGSGEGLAKLRIDAITAPNGSKELGAVLDGQSSTGSAQFLKEETGGGGVFHVGGVEAARRGVTTTITLHGVFSSEGEEFTFQGAENLNRVAKAIAGEKLEIGVSVHPGTNTYPDMSAADRASLTNARLAAVLRQMIDGGVEPQSLYGNFTEPLKPSVTSSEDVASESVELLIRRSFTQR